MAQNDRNTRIAQKAFEMVDKVYGKPPKQTTKPYDPKDEFPSRFSQNAYKYSGPKAYTVKEATSITTISCSRALYMYSPESTMKEPVVSHPTAHIQYFGGARPFVGNPNRFERPKGRVINCDEAAQLYGGVLIKQFRK
ncbi:PREDICTED: uncharacterized protein LOC104723543 [Camelina sativa]|uniref:Uncharacterized protein LOC104723543 n=1 Tax=Camelina sativa TaxID=90675 RepID=A0ABM0UF30_CAMSA|nr:PREDICTED: uncharacterized protein LOC104723543 [Camelina sativa]